MTQPPLPYYRAPEDLRARVTARLREPQKRATVWPSAQLLGVAAALVLVALGSWTVGHRSGESAAATASVLSDHLRSLTEGHLTDVASTDQHTVKPWFAGKLNFSPPVTDFAAAGFPLIGGRVDFVAGHPAAALVYGRHKHIINLFVRPLAAGETAGSGSSQQLGYNLVEWSDSGMRFWAVSDLNAAELAQFSGLLRTH